MPWRPILAIALVCAGPSTARAQEAHPPTPEADTPAPTLEPEASDPTETLGDVPEPEQPIDALGAVPEPPPPETPRWEQPESSLPEGRRVRLYGEGLSIYVVRPSARYARTLGPEEAALVCPLTPCEVWLPNGAIKLAVRRQDSEVVRSGPWLPAGPGSALISARRPRGKRIAGGAVLAAMLSVGATLFGYGVALDFGPLMGMGTLVGSLGLIIGGSFILGAGRPKLVWTPPLSNR